MGTGPDTGESIVRPDSGSCHEPSTARHGHGHQCLRQTDEMRGKRSVVNPKKRSRRRRATSRTLWTNAVMVTTLRTKKNPARRHSRRRALRVDHPQGPD